MTTSDRPVTDEREQGLARRAIGFPGALAMSIAAMGPLLGALGVAPLIVSQAGFSSPFIFIVCWIAMVATALTIGRFSRLLPGAASIYTYVTKGLGERVGFLTA
jgi:amino acid transporter